MKQSIHTVMIRFMSVALFLVLADTCLAVDTKGCLTCHRYPGLVKYEQPDSVMVLHIDEEKHLNSSHGRVDCVDCHPSVASIPHTGELAINCTNGCHVEDKAEIDAIAPSSYKTFHENEKFVITRLDDKTSCRVCHPLYPHSTNKKVRALVNMHTGFMLCEVCHLKKEAQPSFTFDWKEPEFFEFTGKPYGKHEKRIPVETGETEAFISRMLKVFTSEETSQGSPETADYFITRIAVFSGDNGDGKRLFINTEDCSKAEDYLNKEKQLGEEEKKKELEYFHRDIAKKEISVACNECHSSNGIMDFRLLGFNEHRSKDLKHLNIKGLVTKYDTFYIPNLFEGHHRENVR
jgi:hypothetical protein